jgi:hypothetical protein
MSQASRTRGGTFVGSPVPLSAEYHTLQFVSSAIRSSTGRILSSRQAREYTKKDTAGSRRMTRNHLRV